MPVSFPTSPKQTKLYAAWADDALVGALSAGDALAFAQIYERYWFDLFAAAYRRLNSREAAEEIVQDLFTALWHRRREHNIQKLKDYLFTAVKYRVIDTIKARLVHDGYVLHRRAAFSVADRSTEEKVAADDLTLALANSLTRLPKHTREVFRLSRFEHRSVPEIAVRLNLSQKTVEYHLTRALKQLRISLKDFLLLVFIWFL